MTFAIAVTAYLATLYGLVVRGSPRLFFVAIVPLATPFAARRAKLNARATLFTIGVVVYFALRIGIWTDVF